MRKNLGTNGSINRCNIFKGKLKQDFLEYRLFKGQKQGPPYGCFCCLLLSVKSLVKGTSISQDQALLTQYLHTSLHLCDLRDIFLSFFFFNGI